MFKLFRILLIAIVLAALYFYLQQTSFITLTWPYTEITRGASIGFPAASRFHKQQVSNPQLGKTQLEVHDYLDHDVAYICLLIRPSTYDMRDRKWSEIISAVRQLNDTASMSITMSRQFIYREYPAYEYHATSGKEAVVVRLVRYRGQIISLIYAVNNKAPDIRQAEIFFTALRLD